jgi:hypothetical protein
VEGRREMTPVNEAVVNGSDVGKQYDKWLGYVAGGASAGGPFFVYCIYAFFVYCIYAFLFIASMGTKSMHSFPG